MIDLKILKQLVKMMADNDLTELDIQDEGERVKLRRGPKGPEVQYVTPNAAPGVTPAATPPTTPAPTAGSGGDETPSSPADDGLVPIESPMVGTFYRAASPDADPFISEGDSINEESVVCILEAMKVFNEIKAEMNGTIAKVLVENGQAVEFGQPLFMVKPN